MHKVILVEDDKTMLSLIRAFLQIEGFNVVNLVSDLCLDEIVETIRHEQPALVLLDVHLNQLNGFDLLRSIRNEASLKSTRVLMCSGMELGMRCYEEGADGFILKPYMPEELVEKIRQILGN